MTSDRLQGPLRKVDVLDLLAWENNKALNRAVEHGNYSEACGFHVAWQWLTNIVLDKPAGTLTFLAKDCLIKVQTCTETRARIDYTLTYRTKYFHVS